MDKEKIASAVESALMECEEKKKVFIKERLRDVRDYVLWHVGQKDAISSDEYQDPLLPPSKRWPGVTNEEFMNFVDHVIETNEATRHEDRHCPFENKIVRLDGYEYGVMWGQGAHYWVKRLSDKDKERDLSGQLSIGETLRLFLMNGQDEPCRDGGVYTVEAVATDWVVVRDSSGIPRFFTSANWMVGYEDQIPRMIERWKTGTI